MEKQVKVIAKSVEEKNLPAVFHREIVSINLLNKCFLSALSNLHPKANLQQISLLGVGM